MTLALDSAHTWRQGFPSGQLKTKSRRILKYLGKIPLDCIGNRTRTFCFQKSKNFVRIFPIDLDFFGNDEFVGICLDKGAYFLRRPRFLFFELVARK